MSETESHVGTLRPVVKTNEAETTTEIIIRLLGDVELEENEEDLFEQLRDIDDNYDKYFLHNGILWEVVENKELDGDDICEATMQPDGSIRYALQFYNGGTCFSEMMSDALDDLTPNKE